MKAEDLLTLAQWLSPAFPVGGFAYSHGLEAAIAAGTVRDAATARDWIGTVLAHGAGRMDAALLAAAMAAGGDRVRLRALGAEAEALAASRERAVEMREQGAAFARTVAAITGAAADPLPLPVAVGAAAASLSLPPALVAAQYLQAFAATLVSAAVRTVPLGQTEGQAALAALRPVALKVAEAAVTVKPEDVGGAAFGSDLAAMAHEGLAVRLYRS